MKQNLGVPMIPETPRHGVPGEYLITAARMLLSPMRYPMPELVHDALYAGILRKDLVLLENFHSSGIRRILKEGVK